MRQHTGGVLLDHITKPLTASEEARVKLIPEGGDWRDLPNEKVWLPDGGCLEELVYSYKNYHYKNNKHGRERGVCPCMEKEGAQCMESCVQKETVIPYFLVHSGDRNNNYAGMYGRVEKDGVFPTVTTDPRPTGKQGRVLHPHQDRVCSLREFARAQGFPDHYKLSGTRADRYKQVCLSCMLIIPIESQERASYFFQNYSKIQITGGQRRTTSPGKSYWSLYQDTSHLILSCVSRVCNRLLCKQNDIFHILSSQRIKNSMN